MPQKNLPVDLVEKIRYYVKKYNFKINAANKLRLSYDTVLFYTKDIKLKSRKKDIKYLVTHP